MAGKDDLSMDMLTFEGIQLPEDEVIQQEKEEIINQGDDNLTDINNVTDDESQENVGDGTDKSLLEDKDDTPKSPADSDDNVFNTLASFLSEKGLISVQDEKEIQSIKTDDDFAEFMRTQIKNNEYADLTDTQKKYLEGLRSGVPEEVVTDYLNANIAFEKLTDEVIYNNAGVRRDLIIQGYMARGFSEDYAQKQFQRVSDSNEDVEEAKMFRNDLKQIRDQQYQSEVEAQKQREADAQKAYLKQIEDLKESVFKKDKIFDEIAVTQGMKDKVYGLMTKPVAYNEQGQAINAFEKARMENPTEFLVNMYYAYELTNGFKNMSKLMAKATTKVTNSFKNKLQKNNFIPSSQSNPDLDVNPNTPSIVDID